MSESRATELYKYLLDSPWTWGYHSHKSQMRRSIPKWSIFFGGPTKVGQSCYNCENELDGLILDVWKDKFFISLIPLSRLGYGGPEMTSTL